MEKYRSPEGFAHCEAGPLVRSSYHADEQFAAVERLIVERASAAE